MKIILGRQRRRGWVLWAFLVVIAGTIALCKVLINMANQVLDPVPPPPPAQNTNNPPATNPPPKTDIAAFFMLASGSGAPPLIASITYVLMPSSNGVVLAIVDQTAPSSYPPAPQDPTTWTNNAQAWLNNWGIDVDGSMQADWAAQGYVYFTDDHLWHWAFETAEQPGCPVTMDYDSFTYTLANAPGSPASASAYSVTIQRGADAQMRSLTNLDTKTMTVGQFQTFIDYNAPADAAFYRVKVSGL